MLAHQSVLLYQSHNMTAWMIDTFGTEEQRQQWLPKITSMETYCSYCLSEPGSGSDAAALKTKAERDGNGWKINGAKSFISGGETSELYLAMVRTGEAGPKGVSAALIENPSEGLSFGANERKMGWRSQPTAQVNLMIAKFQLTKYRRRRQRLQLAMAGLVADD